MHPPSTHVPSGAHRSVQRDANPDSEADPAPRPAQRARVRPATAVRHQSQHDAPGGRSVRGPALHRGAGGVLHSLANGWPSLASETLLSNSDYNFQAMISFPPFHGANVASSRQVFRTNWTLQSVNIETFVSVKHKTLSF